MKKLTLKKGLALWVAIFGGDVTTVWAADAVREDNSGVFVWIFLAFCALIVIAQIIPAVMVLLGFAKGIKKQTPEAVVKND